jgi:predicted nucleic acid-binding protein
MFTVLPVVTEAMYLLNFSPAGQEALLEMIDGRILRFLSLDEQDVPRIRELMRRYRDLPMDFADAALVRAAERERFGRIFTLDRRDFSRSTAPRESVDSRSSPDRDAAPQRAAARTATTPPPGGPWCSAPAET